MAFVCIKSFIGCVFIGSSESEPTSVHQLIADTHRMPSHIQEENRVRFSDWTPCHESYLSAARSRVKARQTRIAVKAKQTRISSLLASQSPHVGYVCSTPQIFIMTDLRMTDTTEIRRLVRSSEKESKSSVQVLKI